MKVTAFRRLIYNSAWTIFYAGLVMIPAGDLWFIDYPAKLAFAWWFASGVRRVQQSYIEWREEQLHEKIRPITTEPPEIPK